MRIAAKYRQANYRKFLKLWYYESDTESKPIYEKHRSATDDYITKAEDQIHVDLRPVCMVLASTTSFPFSKTMERHDHTGLRNFKVLI